MNLTTKTKYAVSAIVDLALNSNNQPLKREQIAIRQNIPEAFLEQILLELKHNNIIKSVRGPGGGYLLNKPSHDIAISDIVSIIEPISFTRCSSNKDCIENTHEKCKTHKLWKGLEKQVTNYLNNISVADLC